MSDSKISFKIESLPKLEGQSDYTGLALKAYKLWSIIDGTKPRPVTETEKGKEPGESESTAEDQVKWQQQDDQAKAVIMFSVMADDLTTVTDAASAQAAWQALKTFMTAKRSTPPSTSSRTSQNASSLMALLFRIILPDSITIGYGSKIGRNKAKENSPKPCKRLLLRTKQKPLSSSSLYPPQWITSLTTSSLRRRFHTKTSVVNRGVLGSSLYAEALPDGVDILTIDGKQVPQ